MNDTKKERSKINITTKSPSKEHVIISMSFTNMEKVIVMLSKYVTNINRALKNIKSEVVVDFIQKNHRDLVSNLNIIENYIKTVYIVKFNNIMSLRLPQSKLYLKILDISYYIENTNLLITANIIERVLQTTYIFNNTILASCPCIIKTSPKSDMVII